VRGILSHDNQLCVTRCGGLETAQHFFLSCPCFAFLRGLVRSSLGVCSVDPYYLHEHAIQFAYLSGGLRASRSFLQLLLALLHLGFME